MPPDQERICDSVVMFAFEPRIQEPLVYYVDEDEEEQEQEHEEVEEEAEELGPYVPPPFGLILLHEPRFAYVLADPVFFPKTPGQAVTVAFPDGQRMRFDYPVLHETESFFGMVCAYDSVFDTDFESIHQFEIANNLPETGQLVHVHSPEALMLTPGVVIQAIDGNFQATCIASRDTSYSAPVVNDLGQMIGMCKSVESQYVSAINNDTIAAAISRSQGLTFTTLPPVLQYLRQTYGA